MTFILTEQMKLAMRQGIHAEADQKVLTIFRERHGDELAEVDDAEALDRIASARAWADECGITLSSYRTRTLMLGTFRYPRFWEDEHLMVFMRSPTGHPHVRFEDMCGVLKLSAVRAGEPDKVWW